MKTCKIFVLLSSLFVFSYCSENPPIGINDGVIPETTSKRAFDERHRKAKLELQEKSPSFQAAVLYYMSLGRKYSDLEPYSMEIERLANLLNEQKIENNIDSLNVAFDFSIGDLDKRTVLSAMPKLVEVLSLLKSNENIKDTLISSLIFYTERQHIFKPYGGRIFLD